MNQKVQLHDFGTSYAATTHIIDDPAASPGPNQIRTRNHFAGVNGLFDHMVMQGAVGYIPLTAPLDMGVEAVGIVEAAGANSGFNIGDAVATKNLGGAYRNAQIIDAGEAYAVPEAAPEYLAIVPTGISALIALERVAELKPGETVIITAAAGGLGHIWVQLAVNMGCRVIGVAGSDAKCTFVESLGAERCINYKSEALAEVLSSTYKDAINVAIDTVGGSVFDALLDNIAPLGRLVISGYASEIVDGAKPILAPRIYEKLYWKGASVRGFMNALLSEYHRDAASRLFGMMDNGDLVISIDPAPFKGLESLPHAAAHMMSGKNIGKTVLDLR